MPKKLLLADDSITIQRVIELTFSGEDVQVIPVGDGEEAIARIPIEKPDIILADIAMPKRSGYEVSAFVKSSPELEKIPVLLLAGAFEPVDEAKAKEAKCDGVLVKPFEPQHVVALVRELIGGAKGSPTQSLPDMPRPAAALAPPRPVELPKREERVAVPHDLMDMGEDDLLPREDMLPSVQDMDMGTQPIVLDDSLDDYFDKLDEAFATITTTASTPAAGAEPRPARPDRPVLEQDLEPFDEPPMIPSAPPAYRAEPADPFAGIDALEAADAARVPTLDDLLAGMPPGPDSADIDFDAAPDSFGRLGSSSADTTPPRAAAPTFIDIPVPPPAPVPPPIVVAPPTIEPPDVTPTRTASPPGPPMAAGPGTGATAEPPSGRSIIADAFSALLAAEQGEGGAPPPRLAGNGTPSPVVTDTMIDDVARRVIQRLALGSSDQMQAMVKEIVSSVAERLVREEIDRIRRQGAGPGGQ